MNKEKYIKSLYVDKSLADELQFNPYFSLIQTGLGRNITVNDKQCILLGSNDYLGLANSPKLKEAAANVLEKFGISMCGTPIVIGQTSINNQLEQEIAGFLKQEDALVYPSGYQANLAIFSALAGSDDVIIADKEIHSSLLYATQLSSAELRFFPHNNLSRLKKIVDQYQSKRMRFIVLEGLYSTNGDVPDLREIVKIARESNSFIIIDDAHGVGVLGKEGRGILEHSQTFNQVDLISGSLGKGVGTFGGFLAGSKHLIDYFRYSSSMYFYSTALPPSIAAAGIASLKIIPRLSKQRERINRLAKKLKTALGELGFTLTDSTTPVVSVILKDSRETILVTKLLFEQGIYIVPFIPPSVPKRSPRIRISVNANIQEEDIDYVVKTLAEIKGQLSDE
ncbi:MAG: pyridoxal phosphate-dependent aminotransferase family protein [bacterium]